MIHGLEKFFTPRAMHSLTFSKSTQYSFPYSHLGTLQKKNRNTYAKPMAFTTPLAVSESSCRGLVL